jgi:dihydroxyacetone kinase-like protein
MTSGPLSAERLRIAFRTIAADMKAKSDELRELDAACGDGDLGITVTKGFTAIEGSLADLERESPSRLLQSLGITFNNAAASTFGVFFATAFMHAGKAVDGVDEITVQHFCAMLEQAAEGIATRGRAKVGDKTILDALVPAHQAASKAVDAGGEWSEVLSAAAAAAREGAEKTRGLDPKLGRARWLGEQAKGTQDPGATFVSFFLESCCHAERELTKGE